MRIRVFVLSMRPLHWIKNLLVFAAPFTAGAFTDLESLTPLLYLFAMFCAAASTNYVINDWLDKDFDSQHSQKKHRPIASGEISQRYILFIIIFLISIQTLLSFLIPPQAVFWVLVYLFNSIAYSIYFKGTAVVEMSLIASGFVIRALAGAAALKVEASSWFLIVIGFGALFLVANKRLAEVSYQNYGLTRGVLDKYSNSFLRLVSGSSMTVCLVGYTLWALQYSSGTQFSKLSVIAFAVALLRYLWITDQKNAEKPEVVLFTDGVLAGVGLVFILLISSAIYV
jgi:decaprenyl-phosphate phosphoribosyltransferase